MSERSFPELSRRHFLALAGSLALANNNKIRPQELLKHLGQDTSNTPLSPTVVRGNVRFQILSSSVVRMEYAPDGRFVDALSVSVLNRSWPACSYTAGDMDGWLEIGTSRMRVKYKLDAGKFAPGNLVVNWTDENGPRAWKPGDIDDKNLGGVTGDYAMQRALGPWPGPLSRNGYFLLDDSSTAVWNAATQWPEPRPNREEAQDWYFFAYGSDYKALLREMGQLLGPIPMVPRYVFGGWFGDRAGFPFDEFERIVHRFREEEIPLDVVVMDSAAEALVVYAGFGFDPKVIPDPKAYFAWMKAHGVKVTTNEHYGDIDPESDPHFEEVRIALGLPEGTKKIKLDLANQKFAQMYMDVLHKPALDMGLAFWWQDGTASSSMAGLDDQLWTRHVEYEGQERITGKRTFIFCRLSRIFGTPVAWGGHRYGGFFTGDVLTGWSTLDMFVPLNVRSGNMLAPYVASCVGGVAQEIEDEEFYRRAVQLAAFSPVFWWHGYWGLREPWEYGDDSSATVKQFLTLRYRLLPYIYTYSRLAHETSMPLVRGTYLEYPQQEPAYTFTRQFFFGQELLVAPVTQPAGGQPVCKDVYLPEGEHWFDYFTGRIYSGGQVLSYDCPVSRLPLFVKAGSIVPMGPAMDYTDQRPIDPLTVDLYAGKAAAFRLYEDDGLSLDYRKRAYAWTPVSYAETPAAGQHVITIGPTEGRYEGQPKARRYRIQVHGLIHPARVLVNGRLLREKPPNDVTPEGWSWLQSGQVTAIDLTAPIAIRETVTVTLEQAGRFLDAVALDAVRVYRERLRQVKIVEQVRWAMGTEAIPDAQLRLLKVQPNAWRETARVEQTLNDLVDNPAGLADHPQDFKGITAAILNAFLMEPLAPADRFTKDELHRMTGILLDCRIVAGSTANVRPWYSDSGPIVHARLAYDTASIGAPQVEWDFSFPEDGPPGWAEMSRETQPDGSVILTVRAPYPPQPGTHKLKLIATATWGANQTILQREMVWVVPTQPNDGPRPGEN